MQLVVMVQVPAVQSIVSTWPNINIELLDIDRGFDVQLVDRDPDIARDWEMIWGRVSFNMEDVALATGIDPFEVPRLVEIAKRAMLIYPDGTINRYARNFLRAKMAKMIEDNTGLSFKKKAKDDQKGAGKSGQGSPQDRPS